jgi:hypothetical protein
MTSEELARVLSFGSTHSCCVDVREVAGAPGYVRMVTLCEGNRVNIEFDVWGLDEGGLYFWGQFGTFDQMLRTIEDYLQRSIQEWQPEPEYPPRAPETGTAESHRRFRALLTNGGPPLPSLGNFRTQSADWLQFMPSF